MKNYLIQVVAGIGLLVLFSQTTVNAQWVTNGPQTGYSWGLNVNSLAVSGIYIFAGTLGYGVYRSTNNGTSWTQVNSGLTGSALSVQSLAVSGSYIFAGTDSGVYLSTNIGTSWTRVSSGLRGPYNLAVSSFAMSGSNIFAGILGDGVFLSTNNGTSWTPVNSGLKDSNFTSLAVSGSTIFVGSGGYGVYRSTNNGTSWTQVDSGINHGQGYYITSLAVNGSNIFAGTHGSGVFRSANNGTSWSSVNSGLTGLMDSTVQSLAVSGDTIFAGTYDGVFLSTNNGTNWTPFDSGLKGDNFIRSLAVSGSTIFAGTDSGVWSEMLIAPGAPLLSSPANGAMNQPISSTLSWGTVSGATSYSLMVSTSNSFSSTISARSGLISGSCNITGLAASTTYYWQVSATNINGTSAWSSTWSFTTVPPVPGIPVLSSPASGTLNLPSSVTLNWGTVSGATSYSMTAVSTSNSFSSTISAQSGLNSGSCNISGLTASTTYYWQVSATNIGGTSGWSSTWSFTTLPVPGIPVLSSPASGTLNLPSSVTLNWGTVSGATSYNTQLSTNISFANTITSQANLTKGSTTVSGLKNNTSYYWRVAATNAGGSSSWSNAWNFSVNYTSIQHLSESILQSSFSLRNGMVAYSLSQPCPVEIRIYDILGKKIFEFNRMQSAGQYSLILKSLSLTANLYIVHFKAGNMDRRIRCIER